jgi:hypothetical protein
MYDLSAWLPSRRIPAHLIPQVAEETKPEEEQRHTPLLSLDCSYRHTGRWPCHRFARYTGQQNVSSTRAFPREFNCDF